MFQLFYKWFAKTDYRETMREDFWKAYEAGYRAGMTHDKRMKKAPRSPNAKRKQSGNVATKDNK